METMGYPPNPPIPDTPLKWTFAENVAIYATCTQHVPEMSKMGVGQNTFETRKMIDL
jgi:hypothetical protein